MDYISWKKISEAFRICGKSIDLNRKEIKKLSHNLSQIGVILGIVIFNEVRLKQRITNLENKVGLAKCP